eukprot:4586747-Amphidinium_carterae.1
MDSQLRWAPSKALVFNAFHSLLCSCLTVPKVAMSTLGFPVLFFCRFRVASKDVCIFFTCLGPKELASSLKGALGGRRNMYGTSK